MASKNYGEFKPNVVTLTRFLLREQSKHADAGGDFTFLIASIQLACKAIATAVRKAGIAGLYGMEGTVNVQGEDQKKLDILSHEYFVNAIKTSTTASLLVSEEKDEPILIEDVSMRGPYCVCFDPLDGSSNIDCNVSVGSIFAIYKKSEFDRNKPANIEDVLKPGTELAASGYCMYGSATQMVLTFGSGVHVFTHDPSLGEFILTKENVRIPNGQDAKKIYSVNEGNFFRWNTEVQEYVNHLKSNGYAHRYVGSMVADVHRTLLYGGVFIYPADKKSKSGKLRLLYEGNPMSMLIECAGGEALTDFVTNEQKEKGVKLRRVMDVVPSEIHQRTGVFMGSKRDIDILLEKFGQSS